MAGIAVSRIALWLVACLPAFWIAWRWAFMPDQYGYGHAVGDSGDWAIWLLMMTLAVTPIRLMFRRQGWAIWLMRHRRDLGLASFAYGAGHSGIYLVDKASPAGILADLQSADMLTGWIALALFLPLALTSSDAAMRRLKRAWKKLHRLVYPAAGFAFIHWALAAFDPITAYIHIAIMAAIELVRLWLQNYQRAT